VERVDEVPDQNLVMLHGYGAGLGFFYKNFEGLSRAPGWKIYALDLLGMGRSTRPPFKIRASDKQGKITEAENWFVDSLEEWRKERKLEKFSLMGHSLGGYMAACYCLKYPGRVNKLYLVSPVGIPEDPYAVKADIPEQIDSTIQSEITQDQKSVTSGTSSDKNNFMNARKDAEGNEEPKRRPLPKWFAYLWDANISPFSLVRWSGPLGPRFVSGWTSRRFSQFPPEESQALHTYAYTLFKQKGSGEYALPYILAPGAFARSPLIRRIAAIGRQYIKPDGSLSTSESDVGRRRETGIPIILMYGDSDWMDVNGGHDSVLKLEEAKAKALAEASEEEKRTENGSAKVVVIKKAGHHLYLDGWEEFNSIILKELNETRRQELQKGH
jgi:cardiolipin-specific phospholipase